MRNLRILYKKYLLGIEVKACCNWEQRNEGKTATKYRKLRCNKRRKAGKGLSHSGHF